jgi:hypothetical protein
VACPTDGASAAASDGDGCQNAKDLVREAVGYRGVLGEATVCWLPRAIFWTLKWLLGFCFKHLLLLYQALSQKRLLVPRMPTPHAQARLGCSDNALTGRTTIDENPVLVAVQQSIAYSTLTN